MNENNLLKNNIKNLSLSIIIPVYNGQDTIEKCLDSILVQIPLDSEVIIVDDGSTDRTYDICSQLCEKDRRVLLIRQDNGGVSKARNTGIRAASGKYIMFIDCDDIVEDSYFGSFIRAIECYGDRTIVLSRISTHYIEKDLIVIEGSNLETETILNRDRIVDIWDNHLWNSPVNKVYLREVIIDYNICFNTNIKMGEDWLFNNAYARALLPENFYILGDVTYDYYLDKDPWRHCKKEEFYEINKNQVDDFKYTLSELNISEKEVEKFNKRDLDFTIDEIRRIARNDSMSKYERIKQIAKLSKKEEVFIRIKKYKELYSVQNRAEFVVGSPAFVFIWENIRKILGIIRNGGNLS